MNTNRESGSGGAAAARWVLMMAAGGALLLALAPSSRAQSADSQPAALSKQRAALYLEATRTPLADLENDVNHLPYVRSPVASSMAPKRAACPTSHSSLANSKSAMPTTSDNLLRPTQKCRE